MLSRTLNTVFVGINDGEETIVRNSRLYPRLYRADYLTLTSLRVGLSRELEKVNGLLIDYGCGSQPYRQLIGSNCQYVGADFGEPTPGSVRLEADGRLPFRNEEADVILSTQVLEHVADVRSYLGECHRVLKRKGRLILTTHGNWPYHPAQTVGDYWRWTGEGLKRQIESCGFVVRDLRPSCEGKLSLIQQVLALHDPAHASTKKTSRYGRAAWAFLWNVPAVFVEKIAPEWMRSGDILPVDFIVTAEKSE